MKRISLLIIATSLLLSGNVVAHKTNNETSQPVKPAVKKHKAKPKKAAPCAPKPEVVTCSMPKP